MVAAFFLNVALVAEIVDLICVTASPPPVARSARRPPRTGGGKKRYASQEFYRNRRRFAAADAEAGDAAFAALFLQGVEQRYDDARAAGTDGVT
jgi:hypothetical protein